MTEFLSSLNLQGLWEDTLEQITIWVDIMTSTLSALLDPLYQNALVNPLPTGALLLAVVGIPLIFLKIKKSKPETEVDDRLDQLMKEMQSFEIKTPLVDSQENFPGSPIADMEPLHKENSFDFESDPDLLNSKNTHETLDLNTMVELPSLISTEDSGKNGASNRPEEQETTDLLLPADSIINQFQLDDQEFEQEGMAEQAANWSQISRPTLSDYDDTELAIEALENLQQEMAESSLESFLDTPSEQEQEEDANREVEPTSPIETEEETISATEEENHYQEEAPPLQPTDPVTTESEEDGELSVTEEAAPTAHQETNQESFEEIIEEPQFSESLPLKPIQESQPLSNHTRIKSPRKDYKELLESFILLKDQKR